MATPLKMVFTALDNDERNAYSGATNDYFGERSRADDGK